MKVDVRIDPACAEATVTVTAPRMTDEIEAFLRLLAQKPEAKLIGFRDGEAERLDPADILRVYAGRGKVYAVTERGEFELRMRLYEAEQRLEGGSFARISNAEIVNLDRVQAFDLRLSGTILVRFCDGTVTYASRRYVAALKKILGIRGKGK